MPNEAMREKYLAAYRDAFDQAQLLLASPTRARGSIIWACTTTPWATPRGRRGGPSGWPGGTDGQSGRPTPWRPMAEAWRSAPMGGNPVRRAARDSRPAGPGSSDLYFAWTMPPGGRCAPMRGCCAAQTQLVGRLRVSQADLRLPSPAQAQLGVALTWISRGRAPCYAPYGLQLSLVDEQGGGGVGPRPRSQWTWL